MTKEEKQRLIEKLADVWGLHSGDSMYERMKRCIDEFDGEAETLRLTKERVCEMALNLISNAQGGVVSGGNHEDFLYALAYNDAVLDFKDELLKEV
jgi:hypothetical protein